MSFAGGGSDIASFYDKHGGCVLSTTLNKYMYISVHPSFESMDTVLKYSQTEIVDDIDNINHKYFKEVLHMKKYSVNTQAKYFYVEHKSAVTKNETYSVVSENISDMKIAFSYVEAFLKENLAYRQFWDDFVEWKSRYGRYWMRNIQKMKLQQKEKQILIDSLKQIVGENIADVNAADIFYYEKSDILG